MALRVKNQETVAKASGKNIEELKKNQVKSADLAAADYLATIKATRLHTDQRFGDGYFVDFVIDSVITTKDDTAQDFVGKESSFGKFPENAKGGTNAKTGKVLSAKQAREKDEIAVQIAAAAIFGLPKDRAGELTQEQFDSIFEAGAERDASPVIGHKIIVRATNYAPGKAYITLLPAGTTSGAEKAAAPAKKAPPAPKPSFADAVWMAGFVEREEPEFKGWFYNETTGEQLDTDDLKVKLGY
jgi:hypothetical protein